MRCDIGSAKRPDQVPPDGTAASEFGGPEGSAGEGGGLAAGMGFDRKTCGLAANRPLPRVSAGELQGEEAVRREIGALCIAARPGVRPVIADARHSACMPALLCREL
jgi:hypothetical protein